MGKGEREKLLRDTDHESQRLVAIAGGNSPAAEGRQIYARDHEGLLWILPAVASSIAGERRSRSVESLARYGERRARFGMRIETGAPEKKLLSKGRIIRRVMRQAVPDATLMQNGPQSFGSEPEGFWPQLRGVWRRRNERMYGPLSDRARGGHVTRRRLRRLRECPRLLRHSDEESRHERHRRC